MVMYSVGMSCWVPPHYRAKNRTLLFTSASGSPLSKFEFRQNQDFSWTIFFVENWKAFSRRRHLLIQNGHFLRNWSRLKKLCVWQYALFFLLQLVNLVIRDTNLFTGNCNIFLWLIIPFTDHTIRPVLNGGLDTNHPGLQKNSQEKLAFLWTVPV